MKKILHIVAKNKYDLGAPLYEGDTLKTEGFIHCSTPEQVVEVANYMFRGKTGLELLVIDADKVTAPIKYEDAGNGKLYPHIYGPLNTEAVMFTIDFAPQLDGTFKLPDLTDTK